MTGVSVCMVVRDEQEFIRGAVDACLPYLGKEDELVIIDGGSTDNTLTILEEYGDKIRVVIIPQMWDKREWVDEADYRNKCFAECQNDWILSLDADEAYAQSFYADMHSLIEEEGKLAYYFPTINFFGSTKQIIDLSTFPDMHIRLVNKKYFNWVGKIHSSLWYLGARPISPTTSFAGILKEPLFHYARVKGDVIRDYGDVPKKLTDFVWSHPRKEFD